MMAASSLGRLLLSLSFSISCNLFSLLKQSIKTRGLQPAWRRSLGALISPEEGGPVAGTPGRYLIENRVQQLVKESGKEQRGQEQEVIGDEPGE